MELNDKVTQLEDEIKILKNEIQAVLLDLRESFLINKNPFRVDAPSPVPQPPITIEPVPTPAATVCPNSVTETVSAATCVEVLPEPAYPNPGNISALEHGEMEEPLSGGVSFESSQSEELESDTETIGQHSVETKHITGKVNSPAAKEWRVKSAGSGICSPSGNSALKSENIEISVIAKLADWVGDSVKQLGTRKTETMLDIAEMMAYIGPDLKVILSKLILPLGTVEINKSDARDYLASWLKLADILGRDNKPEIALFYILCQEAENR
jgi:hypothetical protein